MTDTPNRPATSARLLPSILIVGGVLAVLLVLIVTVLGRSRATFSRGTFAEVEQAMRDKGLHICRTEDVPDGQANQAVRSVIFVAGQSDDRSQNRIDQALRRLGAQ